ncbi:MAG: uracil-DNA glycosylase [Deltaproteobacteria bacterium]|nr:uracil-DNA glycosylase [Deltaproteobacteria bacterium]
MDKEALEGIIGRLKYLRGIGIGELPFTSKEKRLKGIGTEVTMCKICPLHRERKNAVCGKGNSNAAVLFAGGVPSGEDDAAGEPFTGGEGEQLANIIKAMGLETRDAYITNVIRCRPSGNRKPAPEEFSLCMPYLEREVDTIGPAVIVLLGDVPTRAVLGGEEGVGERRGRFHLYRGVKLMPTHGISSLLERPELKKDVWHDIQMVMGEIREREIDRGRL